MGIGGARGGVHGETFLPVSPAMVRLPLLTLSDYRAFFAPPGPDDAELVRRTWSHPWLREAVRAANPELAETADRFLCGGTSHTRRLAAALSNYAVRMTSRPTPFGLFGGVGFVGWGSGEPVRRVGGTTVSRLGARVLEELAREAEADPVALSGLVVGHNPTLRRGAHRVEVLVGTEDDVGARVSVRRTAVLDLVLAVVPSTGAELLSRLGERHPDVPGTTLVRYVLDLVAMGVLVTSLRPPGGSHRVELLADRSGSRDLLAEYDRTPIGAGEPVLARVREALGGGRRGDVSTDVALTLRGELPSALAGRLARAAGVLQAVARTVPGSPGLAAYARTFEARFGGEEVPLAEVLDRVRGLGPPPGYRGGPPAVGGPAAEHLTSLRRTLLARAVGGVVELAEDDLAGLPDPVRGPLPSCDLFVLVGEPVEAHGLAVIGPRGFSFPAGRASSRFAHLDPRVEVHVRAVAEPEREANPDVLFADVEYRYPDPDVGDLVVGVTPYPARILTTALAGPSDGLTLNDIVVGVHDGTWYLRSGVDGRRVVARSHHLLSLREAPNAVRFLREVSDDGFAVPGWSWDEFAETHPALPRVHVGGVVVAPARWRVPEPGDRSPDWPARWREQLGVPRFVYIGHLDNRLLLDLEVAAHREELTSRVRRGAAYVEEASHAERDGVAEIVVSLVNPRPPVWPSLPDRGGVPVPDVAARTRQPGDGWWSLHLHGRREAQDEALVALRAAFEVLGAEWFFVRYNAPTDHLRVRVRAGTASVEDLGEVARRLHDRELAGRVAIEPYQADVQRFGGVDGLARAERLFCQETPPVVDALVEVTRSRDAGMDAIGVGCLFAAGYLSALGVDEVTVDAVLARTAGTEALPPLRGRQRAREHEQRRLLVDQLVGRSRPPELAVVRSTIASIGERVADASPAPGSPDVVRALLHLHLNRLGFSRTAEARIGTRLHGTRHSATVRSTSHRSESP